uniref:Uncharacterized protein n=1 Tax=Opuntia streptacantha TaxID=393608 RepID=A0A7C9CHT3_OPUST
MTSITASHTLPDDTSRTDDIIIDIDALEAGFGEIRTYYSASPLISTDTIFLDNVDAVAQLPQAQAQHQQHEMRSHDRAEPELLDIHHAVMEEILQNQNNPDVSKKLLEITGASIDSLAQLAYQSPRTTSPAPRLKMAAASLCLAHILLLAAIVLREPMPRAARVTEKLGMFFFISWILLLMWYFIA